MLAVMRALPAENWEGLGTFFNLGCLGSPVACSAAAPGGVLQAQLPPEGSGRSGRYLLAILSFKLHLPVPKVNPRAVYPTDGPGLPSQKW